MSDHTLHHQLPGVHHCHPVKDEILAIRKCDPYSTPTCICIAFSQNKVWHYVGYHYGTLELSEHNAWVLVAEWVLPILLFLYVNVYRLNVSYIAFQNAQQNMCGYCFLQGFEDNKTKYCVFIH